jgi:hypothetical protein
MTHIRLPLTLTAKESKKGFKVNSIYSRAVLKPTDAYWGYVRQTTNIVPIRYKSRAQKMHGVWSENL